MSRLESNLNFSRDANQSLKNDYDLLQEKFDKHMKATNNLNQDLKMEIDKLNQICQKRKPLLIFHFNVNSSPNLSVRGTDRGIALSRNRLSPPSLNVD